MDPIATKITAVSASAVSIMGALYSHFRTASLLFRVVENGGVPVEAGTNPGEDGFLITPKSFETFQVNFRLATDEVFVSLDPQAALTITDPTNPGTGASSEWSGETTSSVGQLDLSDISGELWLVEMEDAFFILNIGSDNLTMTSACHVGRVYTPFFPSQVTDKVDGLAVLGRLPRTSDTTGQYYWMSTSTTTSSASLWRTGESTWTEGLTSHEWQATATNIVALGRAEPVPVLCFRAPDTFFGETKYLASVYPADTPWTVIQDEDQVPRYMHVGNASTGTYGLVITWDPEVSQPV